MKELPELGRMDMRQILSGALLSVKENISWLTTSVVYILTVWAFILNLFH